MPANSSPPSSIASGKLSEFSEAIKLQHSVFALPFAVLGLLQGILIVGYPGHITVALALGCCVLARTSAMAFNRWLDSDIDARNPRTASRAIPAGRLSPRFMFGMTVLSAIGFIVMAALINPLAGWLSPVALIVVLGYSFTKRFTTLCHFVLGLALALAPAGGFVAVTGSLSIGPILMSLGVLLWTAGFDIIYACQDEEFDRAEGLYSIPSVLGYRRAMIISAVLHGLCVPTFVASGLHAQLGLGYLVGCGIVTVILIAQHSIVHRIGPRAIPMAFFTVNGWTGIALLACTVAGLWLDGRL